MQDTDLGPNWEPQPEMQDSGFARHWLLSRRFGITQNDQGAWSVIDRDGRETHGDLIWDPGEARALAEHCDALAGSTQPDP